MNLTFPSPEFDEAVAAVCHGSAAETQLTGLNGLLRRDPAARDEYLFRLELHSRLASEPDLFSDPAEALPAFAPAVAPPAADPIRPANTTAPRTARRPLLSLHPLALAAGVVLALGSLWLFAWGWSHSNRPATSTAVAVLTRAVDAEWAEGSARPRVGSPLKPGWLHLKSGLVQVVFYSGTRVVIEGPAALRLVSANEAACPHGRLLAEVPEPARGFRLRTDQLNVVDLGTSFGIDATSRQTQVHVFKGKVEVAPGTSANQPLNEMQAAVVQEHSGLRLMPASTNAFASMFEFQERSLASEAYRYEQWQFANARLNEDPSLVLHLDFGGPDPSDWTLGNTAGSHRSVPNAARVGCARAEGRWREKQALEFQNVSDRVRLAIPGDYTELTLAAWVRLRGLDRPINSLFMCDGFGAGTIHWLIRDDSAQGLTVLGHAPGQTQILVSPAVPALQEFGMWVHLAAVLDGRNKRVVHYCNGLPVSQHPLSVSPPFHLGAAELGNWNAPSEPDPKPFLIRNLSGALDEFMLFDRAFTDAQLLELYNQGKPDP